MSAYICTLDIGIVPQIGCSLSVTSERVSFKVGDIITHKEIRWHRNSQYCNFSNEQSLTFASLYKDD